MGVFMKLFVKIITLFIPIKSLRHAIRRFFDDRYINPLYSPLDMLLKNHSIYRPAVGYLRDIQLASVKILKEVDRICNEFNIQYFISFGTLLGAVRHGGFIPWDDDIDISMLRDDYKKFVDIFNKNTVFDELQAIFANTGSHIKVCLKGTSISLDIFCCDVFGKNMSTDEKISFSRKLNSLSKNKMLKNISKNSYNIEAEKLTNKLIERENSNECLKKSTIFYSIEFRHKWTCIVFDYSSIFPLKKIEFEGTKFYAPKNIDEYLTFIYGNYMEIPNKIKLHSDYRKIGLSEILKIKEFLR